MAGEGNKDNENGGRANGHCRSSTSTALRWPTRSPSSVACAWKASLPPEANSLHSVADHAEFVLSDAEGEGESEGGASKVRYPVRDHSLVSTPRARGTG